MGRQLASSAQSNQTDENFAAASHYSSPSLLLGTRSSRVVVVVHVKTPSGLQVKQNRRRPVSGLVHNEHLQNAQELLENGGIVQAKNATWSVST